MFSGEGFDVFEDFGCGIGLEFGGEGRVEVDTLISCRGTRQKRMRRRAMLSISKAQSL